MNYHNYYINAAEDYCRKYIWTVCPFWGTMFVRAIVERIPLDWTGFTYFTHFMKALDPRLLQAPVFGKSVNLNSERSLNVLDLKRRVKTWITAFLPIAHYFYKNIQSKMKDNDQLKIMESALRDITCPLIQSTFPQDQLKILAGNVLISRRYLTLLLYFREIEKRFSKNISTQKSA